MFLSTANEKASRSNFKKTNWKIHLSKYAIAIVKGNNRCDGRTNPRHLICISGLETVAQRKGQLDSNRQEAK